MRLPVSLWFALAFLLANSASAAPVAKADTASSCLQDPGSIQRSITNLDNHIGDRDLDPHTNLDAHLHNRRQSQVSEPSAIDIPGADDTSVDLERRNPLKHIYRWVRANPVLTQGLLFGANVAKTCLEEFADEYLRTERTEETESKWRDRKEGVVREFNKACKRFREGNVCITSSKPLTAEVMENHGSTILNALSQYRQQMCSGGRCEDGGVELPLGDKVVDLCFGMNMNPATCRQVMAQAETPIAKGKTFDWTSS